MQVDNMPQTVDSGSIQSDTDVEFCSHTWEVDSSQPPDGAVRSKGALEKILIIG